MFKDTKFSVVFRFPPLISNLQTIPDFSAASNPNNSGHVAHDH